MNNTEMAIEWLEENMPPLEDYGEMIGAPPQYCGIKYVYNDPCGYIFETAIQALQEKAEREKLQENCACMTNNKACCTCISMRCHYCIKQSNYTRGSFCCACGRKLTSAPTDER